MREMGCDSTASSPGGKRVRDPEEEVYLDNFHSHKRYLSEVMASSLNGLTVGDSLAENLMESPAREEFASQYSPMSEDSEDSRHCENPMNFINTQHSDAAASTSSPVSPHRNQRPTAGPVAAGIYPLPSCTLSAVICSHPRQRSSEADSRFPSSPNDVCHAADLRRAALLRSVQIRAQEERPNSCSKTIEDGVGYQSPEREAEDYIEDCSSLDVLNHSKLVED